jgi:hypothetical protein
MLLENGFPTLALYFVFSVSHALRSRPVSYQPQPKRPYKPRKRVPRKPAYPADLEETASRLIQEQQQLLKSMIDKKVFPGWMQEVKDQLVP